MADPSKTDIKLKVCNLINKRPDYSEILERAIELEKNPSDEFVAKYGWEWDQVKAHPGKLTKMIAEGILKVGYKSNRYKHYQLVDRDSTAEALKSCVVK